MTTWILILTLQTASISSIELIDEKSCLSAKDKWLVSVSKFPNYRSAICVAK